VYTVRKIIYSNYKRKNNAKIVDPGKKPSEKRRQRTCSLEDNLYRSACWLMTNEKLVGVSLNLFPGSGAINSCSIAARLNTIKITR
jgi:hypothetical protein